MLFLERLGERHIRHQPLDVIVRNSTLYGEGQVGTSWRRDMSRTRRVHLVALVTGLLLVASPLAGCVYQDPPPEAMVRKRFEVPRVFHLNPEGTDGDRFSGFLDMPTPDADVAIKAVSWKVLDGDGEEIAVSDPRIHFHHAVAYSSRQPDPVCGGDRHRWNAPGSERTDLELPNGYAYFVNKTDDWRVNIDLMNLSDEQLTDVKLVYDITYATDRSTLHDVTPYWLDASGCRGSFVLSGDGDPAIYTRQASFTLPQPGRVVAVRGHFHPGGIDATLSTVEAGGPGREICRTTGVYGEPGGGHEHGGNHGEPGAEPGPAERNLVAIPLCKNLSFSVTAGQQVRVAVRYHNDVYMADAMASMLVYVAEDRVQPPPAPPTTAGPEAPPITLGGQAKRVPAGPVVLPAH
jgi:hypothetical protein